MSSVVISGDTSGAITLSAPAVSGTNTATLPAATGTVMVSGNMPAFSAWKSSGTQALSSNTWTKITFPTEDFDTANCFASSTFTPNVAGYYQLNVGLDINVSGTVALVGIYKNGAIHRYVGSFWAWPSATYETQQAGSALVSANGTTDYFEVYVKLTGSSTVVYSDITTTFFQGSLVRTS
jgi:hypothetical protein